MINYLLVGKAAALRKGIAHAMAAYYDMGLHVEFIDAKLNINLVVQMLSVEHR